MRERFLLLTATLSYEDFDSFLRGKALWHRELAELKDSTLVRLRSNLFQMLREADLLSDGGQILRAVVSERVAKELAARMPSDVLFFPLSDLDSGGPER